MNEGDFAGGIIMIKSIMTARPSIPLTHNHSVDRAEAQTPIQVSGMCYAYPCFFLLSDISSCAWNGQDGMVKTTTPEPPETSALPCGRIDLRGASHLRFKIAPICPYVPNTMPGYSGSQWVSK